VTAVSTRRRPRVSFVCDSDAWGGAEVYLTHLLRRGGARGWTASLVCAEDVAERFADAVPQVLAAVVPLARHGSAAPSVRGALDAQRPDVVVVNLVDPGSNAAAVAAALEVAPTVGVLHLPGDTGTGERRARLAALYGALAGVLTPAVGARGQLVAELGVPRDRVRVVPNGVDVPEVPAGPAGHAVPRVGGLGRLTDQMGFDVLLEAVRRLRADGVELDVVIGGVGRDCDRLSAAAAGLPVTFAGFVERPREFLGDLDVFCLSSRREAMPLVLLEAMAEGLPCVATDVGDVRIAVGPDALVVPPADPAALAGALRLLVGNPALGRDLGLRARRRAERAFDAELMADRTYAELDRVRRSARLRAAVG
jgi:glycosyltransferase involved in cell wall biosynthesis